MTKSKCQKWIWTMFLFSFATAAGGYAQTFTTVTQFNITDGAAPNGPLAQGADGRLYGTTSGGGSGENCPSSSSAGCGTIFKTSTTITPQTLYNFCSLANCADGENPYAGLILTDDGDFLGTTSAGGANGFGTVFRVTSLGALTTLHSFSSTDGAMPVAGLLQASNGNYYGTTSGGGANGAGTVFKMTSSGALTTLHSFCAQPSCTDGSMPFAALIQARDGNLYGTTLRGGGYLYYGTVFKVTLSGAVSTFCSFDYVRGAYPFAGLVQGPDGNFYGTAEGGGPDAQGVVFELTPSGKLETLHSFTGQIDGASPAGGLALGTDGNFYGTTSEAGFYFSGTLFEITPGGTLTTLHYLEGNGDGAIPGALNQQTGGNIYGVNALEGVLSGGTVFSENNNLPAFVAFVQPFGKVGQTGGILGQGFKGTTAVSVNGIPAEFTVIADTFLQAIVPVGATTGYVTVTTPKGMLTSNVPFHVLR